MGAAREEAEPTRLTLQDYLSNFPFEKPRPKQVRVLDQICNAFNSGKKIIVLEAPTGFGKSPVAVCVAKTLGSSWFVSANKNLQTQYANDFPWLRTIKGKDNFECLVKQDFDLDGNYDCAECRKWISNDNPDKKVDYAKCPHKSVNYGPCKPSEKNSDFEHVFKDCSRCAGHWKGDYHEGCRYRTTPGDYVLTDRNTRFESVFIPEETLIQLRRYSCVNYDVSNDIVAQRVRWMHDARRGSGSRKKRFRTFTPCPYFDQRSIGVTASHTILNYSNFQLYLRMGRKNNNPILNKRELLILDEGHQIENKVIEYVYVSLKKKVLERYTDELFEFESLNFQVKETNEDDDTWHWRNISLDENSPMSDWVKFINRIRNTVANSTNSRMTLEMRTQRDEFVDRLDEKLEMIEENENDWILDKLEYDENGRRVTAIEFRPLNASWYAYPFFKQCERTIIMSATIIDAQAFCKSIGLSTNDIEFIRVDSDFPLEHRKIYKLNEVYLNWQNKKDPAAQQRVVNAVERVMSHYPNVKGIIHTTNYEQLRYITKGLSQINRRRLIATEEGGGDRDRVLYEHSMADRPTVLISPSLHTGIDLKDDLSRFQIIVKTPYPQAGKKDRWTRIKRDRDPRWYNWCTGVTFMQACGRSVRSVNDYADTYVIDSGITSFLIRYNQCPKWFTDSIQKFGSPV